MDSNLNKILKDIFPHQFNIILIILCKALLKYPLRRKKSPNSYGRKKSTIPLTL